jgi:hypothetical protein
MLNEAGREQGGEAKIQLHRFAYVRFDYREYATAKPYPLVAVSGWLRMRELSGAAGILF